MLCGQGSMKLLRYMGFKTFSPWINESYDEIKDLIPRIDAITKEIDRLASMSQQEWNDTLAKINDISQHNREIYRDWKPETKLP